MTARGVLAVDFGTANTYFSKCPGDALSTRGVDFGEGRDGLATAILYREGRTPLVGARALHEFGEATPAERARYRLRTHFKPDIARGEEARAHARDFLAAVLDDARRGNLDIEPAERTVIFGVPSESGIEFRRALQEVVREAGFGEIEMLDEPKGALLHHVTRGDIAAREALGGVLVVDFGGGTCDFAYMLRGQVRESWGEMALGGRLFDDLFYQWFIEQNPGAADALRTEHSEYFAQAYLARETKEFFSRAMARERGERLAKKFGDYGRLTDMTWEEFERRARAYRPSSTLLAQAGAAGLGLPHEDGSQSVDLIDWFRRALRGGFDAGRIARTDLRHVILAGGSSLWPFVADILTEELGVAPRTMRRSDRPYAAISEGLAVLPAQRRRFAATREALEREYPAFRDQTLKSWLRGRVAATAADLSERITVELFDERIRPLLAEFRERGGAVAGLRQRLADAAAAAASRIESIVAERVNTLVAAVPVQAGELLADWLRGHGVTAAPAELGLPDVRVTGLGDISLPSVYADAVTVLQTVVAGVVAAVGGMIAGGAHTAIIMTGPIGWMIGAVVAGVAAFLALSLGRRRAAEVAENWEAPAMIVRPLLSESKIASARAQTAAQLRERIERQLGGLAAQLEAGVERQVRAELEALSEMNGL